MSPSKEPTVRSNKNTTKNSTTCLPFISSYRKEVQMPILRQDEAEKTSVQGREANVELVADFWAYFANFWFNVAFFHVRVRDGKFLLAVLALAVLMYGGSVILLIAYVIFLYVIWSFPCKQSHHAGCSSRLQLLLGRSWRLSEPDASFVSNNNVSLINFKDAYYAAYRNADMHWPSQHACLIVVRAPHPSGPWTQVWKHKTGEDLREMMLFEFNGTLYLYYCAIDSGFMGTFNVKGTRCFISNDGVEWRTPSGDNNGLVGRPGELIWDVKVVVSKSREPTIYKTSYIGGHYQNTGQDQMRVLFEKSHNGVDWSPCGSREDSTVYMGGVSEVSFEFTQDGDLVGIGRLEDGDVTGFGTQLFFAEAADLGTWQALKTALPWRFDSPRMCRVDATGDVLLFARYTYQKYGVLPSWFPLKLQAAVNIVLYSVRPKTAAIYRLLPPASWKGASGPWATCEPLELVRFFEHGHAVADTGYFSIVPHPRIKDSWYVANYSAVGHSNAWWVYGQLTESHIYVAELRIEVEEQTGQNGANQVSHSRVQHGLSTSAC